jgi:hypothetical protein
MHAQTIISTTRNNNRPIRSIEKLACSDFFKAFKNHITLEYLLNARNPKREDLSHPMRLMTRTLTFS